MKIKTKIRVLKKYKILDYSDDTTVIYIFFLNSKRTLCFLQISTDRLCF